MQHGDMWLILNEFGVLILAWVKILRRHRRLLPSASECAMSESIKFHAQWWWCGCLRENKYITRKWRHLIVFIPHKCHGMISPYDVWMIRKKKTIFLSLHIDSRSRLKRRGKNSFKWIYRQVIVHCALIRKLFNEILMRKKWKSIKNRRRNVKLGSVSIGSIFSRTS